MGEKKDTFILRAEWIEDIELMSMEERGELLTMLFDSANGIDSAPDMSTSARLIHRVWRRFIDACDEHWEDVRKERSKAGKASAASRKRKKAIEQNQENCDSVQQNSDEILQTTPVYQEASEQTGTNLTNVDFVPVRLNKNGQTGTNTNLSVSVSVSDSVSVTDTVPETVTDREEKASKKEEIALAELIAHYEAHIAPITPEVASNFLAFLKEMDAPVLMEAINEAVRCNAPRWRYLRSIIATWLNAGVIDIDSLDNYRMGGRRKQNGKHEQPGGYLERYSQPQPPGVIVLG